MGIVEYDFDIVGGAYDGAPALAWIDDGKHPPPELIFVGVCGKGRDCGTTKCRPSATHISYWTKEEMERPPESQPYTKQDEYVKRDEAGMLHGRVVYAIGGLLDPRNFGAEVREDRLGTVTRVREDGGVEVELGEPVTAYRSFAEQRPPRPGLA